MFAALVAGLAPALKATRPNLVNELKSDVSATQAGGRRWTLRDGLVVTQIAVTMVLLVRPALLTRSLMAAQHVEHRLSHRRASRSSRPKWACSATTTRARRSSTNARSSG